MWDKEQDMAQVRGKRPQSLSLALVTSWFMPLVRRDGVRISLFSEQANARQLSIGIDRSEKTRASWCGVHGFACVWNAELRPFEIQPFLLGHDVCLESTDRGSADKGRVHDANVLVFLRSALSLFCAVELEHAAATFQFIHLRTNKAMRPRAAICLW